MKLVMLQQQLLLLHELIHMQALLTELKIESTIRVQACPACNPA